MEIMFLTQLKDSIKNKENLMNIIEHQDMVILFLLINIFFLEMKNLQLGMLFNI